MTKPRLIPAQEICRIYHVEYSFVNALKDYGLLDITRQADDSYIHEDQLEDLERLLTLHYEMDINVEGIEAIAHILQRFKKLQDEMKVLKNRLRLYETID